MVHISQSPVGHDLMCIVYHDDKSPVYHYRQLKLHLQQKFDYIRIFTDLQNLSDYFLHTFIVNNLIIIVSGNEAQFVCETIENEKESLHYPLLYELQFDKKPLKSELSNDRRFQSIDGLIKKIDDDIKDYAFTDKDELDSQPEVFLFGIHDIFRKQESFCYLNREELKFKLFQSFIEVLLGIENDENDALEQMWTTCREKLASQGDYTHLKKVDEFERDYDSIDPIQLYTKSSFFFRIVNEVLRCEDFERIFDFQPFIARIHQRLNDLCTEQRPTIHCLRNLLYRGKKLPKSVIQQLEDSKDKFISINGFLSTTKNNDVAKIFAGIEGDRPGYQSVVFEMDIDGKIDTKRPYADISEVGQMQDEEEVLFFMGFVWRIQAVDRLPDNSWKIILKLSNDINSEFTRSFNQLDKKCTFFQLGKILHELGEYKNAINFYERMLKLPTELLDKRTCADIHFHIAISALDDGSCPQALHHLEQAERFIKELNQPNNSELDKLRPFLAEDASISLMSILMNKGLVYQKKKDSKHAEQSFNEALKQHGSPKEKAYVHYNFGQFLVSKRRYSEARNNYLQAFQLAKDQNLKDNINQILRNIDQI
jgi:tetratricopeptide (TPR) repeat protein